MIDFNKVFNKLAAGEPLDRPKQEPPTSYIKGAPAELRCKKEIYRVVKNSKGKPYMVMAAFLLDEGTSTHGSDIRYGISRCHPKDKFNLKLGMKLAKKNAFYSENFYGASNCWLNNTYRSYYINFTNFCNKLYDYGQDSIRDNYYFRNLLALHNGIKKCRCKKIISTNINESICYKCGKVISLSKYICIGDKKWLMV